MTTYILRRLLLIIPTVLGIVTVTFFASRIGGVSPAVVMFPKASPAVIAEMEKKNGWDRPLLVQYVAYLRQLSRLDLGKNMVVSSHTVAHELKNRFPATAELALTALALAALVGIPIGILAAVKANSWFDYSSMTLALTGISFPVFWLAMLLIILVGYWLPFHGRIDPHLVEKWEFTTRTNFLLWDTFWYGNWTPFFNAVKHLWGTLWYENWTQFFIAVKHLWVTAWYETLFFVAVKHLILPAIALATIPLAVIARITRAAMLEVLQADYIRTARAKGLAPLRVIGKHALKNALPHINTTVGLQTGYLLSGAILTESIFSWNGIGTYVLDTAKGRDYYGLLGSVILIALIFVFVNLLVDLSYTLFDPRIRIS